MMMTRTSLKFMVNCSSFKPWLGSAQLKVETTCLDGMELFIVVTEVHLKSGGWMKGGRIYLSKSTRYQDNYHTIKISLLYTLEYIKLILKGYGTNF